MARIDTGEWEEFVVGDLFPNIVKPPVLHARQIVESADGIPYVVRTKFNNGVKCRALPVSVVGPSPAGVITWGAENAAFFYQAERFLSGRDIYYIDTRGLSANACLFVAACLQTTARRYPYNYGLFPELLREERIKLPVNAEGAPDWARMDSLMAAIMEESASRLENLGKIGEADHRLDPRGWKPVEIGRIFDIRKGTRLTRAKMTPGDTPFVGATLENNGVTAYVGNGEHIHPGGTITVAYNGQKAAGKAFYQPKPFWASDDVNVLYPKFDLTEEIAVFLLPLIWEAGRPFSFDDKWGKETMEQTTLTLPVNAEGAPDWAFIDEFMRSEMNDAGAVLSALQSIR